MKEGAMGGKIIGAGGGGYLLFYASDAEKRQGIRQAMLREGLEELKYRFDFNGSAVLVDDGVESRELVTL
jgi:D-glycero-alpha-D-manno-heptose-7-phosphate kinase